jgi:hypothetical protein
LFIVALFRFFCLNARCAMCDCHGPKGSKAFFASQCFLDSESYLNAVMASARAPIAAGPPPETKKQLKDLKGMDLPEEEDHSSSAEMGLRVASEALSKADALQRIRSKSFLGDLGGSSDSNGAEPPEAIEFTRVLIDRKTAFHDPDAKIACVIIDKALALRQRWQSAFPAIDPDEQVCTKRISKGPQL